MHPIYIENKDFSELIQILTPFQHQKIFLLVDEKTRLHCKPLLDAALHDFRLITIEIKSGEINKTIQTCEFIWENLLYHQANRNSLLINLGGGVLTDIGGFVAATFKRGIKFINVPTTVLGAADAAVGGKTGVDLKMFKNQVGLFTMPEAVIIHPAFFKTLPIRQVNSGLAEIIKSALIADKNLWQVLLDSQVLKIIKWEEILNESVRVKTEIVRKDLFETGDRKLLNFGHTIGHAIETFSLKHDEDPLLHGEAVALGMICESYLSFKKLGLSESDLNHIVKYIFNHYHLYDVVEENIDEIIELMVHDKKNIDSNINFTLLSKIGEARIDQFVDLDMIREALKFYVEHINNTY